MPQFFAVSVAMNFLADAQQRVGCQVPRILARPTSKSREKVPAPIWPKRQVLERCSTEITVGMKGE